MINALIQGIDYKKPIIPNGHFTWGEALWLPRMNKYATINATQKTNIIFLATKIEPLRVELGHDLQIVSGIRTPEYTRLLQKAGIPAATGSAHEANNGAAWDLVCRTMTNAELWEWFNKRWPGRMELLKYTPSWCHLDTRNFGRAQRFIP
jgi:hypothetical protein